MNSQQTSRKNFKILKYFQRDAKNRSALHQAPSHDQKCGDFSSVGRVVFLSGASCLGASCLGASFMWGELSWGELSLGRVVLIPPDRF